MDEKNVAELRRAIRATVRELRADGITGMSLENLKQVTPTRGLTCAPAAYHGAFAEVALSTARDFIIG